MAVQQYVCTNNMNVSAIRLWNCNKLAVSAQKLWHCNIV